MCSYNKEIIHVFYDRRLYMCSYNEEVIHVFYDRRSYMCSFNVYHIGTLEVYQPSKPKWGTQKWFQIRYFLYVCT